MLLFTINPKAGSTEGTTTYMSQVIVVVRVYQDYCSITGNDTALRQKITV